MTPDQILEATAKAIHDHDDCCACRNPDCEMLKHHCREYARMALTLALDAAAEAARTFEMVPRLRRDERVVARAIADEIDALKPNA